MFRQQKKTITEVSDGDPSVSLIKPSSLSFISAYFNHIHLSCLLDTGATHSSIHTSIVHRLRNISITNIKQRFTLADGNTNINIIGRVNLKLRIGQITTNISAFISKSLSHPCILGQDWLHKYAVDICQSTKQITIHTVNSTVTVPMDVRIEQHQFALKTTVAVIIPPQHERIVELQSPISSSPQVIFHPNRSLQSHNLLAIPHALYPLLNIEHISLLLILPTKYVVFLLIRRLVHLPFPDRILNAIASVPHL